MPKKAANSRNSRGFSNRKVNTRQLRQYFLIVCEGEKTEPKYFQCFRVPMVIEVEMKGYGKNPSRLVEKANQLKQEDDYDQVWCVFDRDDVSVEDFNNAIQRANHLDILVAYSNEAFELWYVLHFEFLNTGIPRADYCKKLDGLLGQKYQKNSSIIYDLLQAKQATAMKNATKLLSQYQPAIPVKDNPSTTVHLLVEQLNLSMP